MKLLRLPERHLVVRPAVVRLPMPPGSMAWLVAEQHLQLPWALMIPHPVVQHVAQLLLPPAWRPLMQRRVVRRLLVPQYRRPVQLPLMRRDSVAAKREEALGTPSAAAARWWVCQSVVALQG